MFDGFSVGFAKIGLDSGYFPVWTKTAGCRRVIVAICPETRALCYFRWPLLVGCTGTRISCCSNGSEQVRIRTQFILQPSLSDLIMSLFFARKNNGTLCLFTRHQCGNACFVLSSIFKCNFLVSGRVNDVNDILLLHVKSWCQD